MMCGLVWFGLVDGKSLKLKLVLFTKIGSSSSPSSSSGRHF